MAKDLGGTKVVRTGLVPRKYEDQGHSQKNMRSSWATFMVWGEYQRIAYKVDIKQRWMNLEIICNLFRIHTGNFSNNGNDESLNTFCQNPNLTISWILPQVPLQWHPKSSPDHFTLYNSQNRLPFCLPFLFTFLFTSVYSLSALPSQALYDQNDNNNSDNWWRFCKPSHLSKETHMGSSPRWSVTTVGLVPPTCAFLKWPPSTKHWGQ